MMRKSVLIAAVCLALFLPAWAQINQPPVCSLPVSPSSGTAPLLVTANPSCSDPENDITTVTLDWGDGSPEVITTETSFSVQHTYGTAGTYTITVTATDLGGLMGSATQNVTITTNQPPTCSLKVNPTSGTAPLPVKADGKCNDPENDITSIMIDWGDGTTTTGPGGSHTYTTAGTFTVIITATDSGGLTGSASQTVTVTAPNQPPTCTLSVVPTSGTAPLTVTATGSCSDPENDIVSTTLNWGDGTSTPASSGTHTYKTGGSFTVTVTATDSGGKTGSASQVVHVAGNAPPSCVLAVAPSSGTAPLTVSATGNCTDPENDISTTVLNWGDGSTTNATSGTHTYTSAGSYTVRLTATDTAGNTGSASQPVTVTAPGPPSCTVTVSPNSGTAPLAVNVNANCADSDNDVTTVVTNFGDGFYMTGATPSHTYVNGGTFTVSVVASDKAGNTSKPATQTVTVTENPLLFVGVSNGQIQTFTESGSRGATLNTNQGGSITGMAFDARQNLYTTDFTADTVSQFSGNSTLMGTFGSGYNCKPESIVFDQAGNAYVGETGCSHAMLKFDAYGNLAATYSVAIEQEGSDWIDLASDGCTVYYTSQGASVLRYNVCSKQQLAPFANGLVTGLGLHILPDGGVLVAEKKDIVRFDSAGRNIMTYTASGENCWVAVALDSDPSKFWAADYCTSDLVRFDLNSGNELFKFNSGTAANTVFGLAVRSAPAKTTPAGPLIATPAQASISAGQSATFALNLQPSSAASGQTFTFSCADLPANSSCSFSPSSADAGASGLTTQLTITTVGPTASLTPGPNSSGRIFALALPLFGMALLVLGVESDGRRKRTILLLVLLAGLLPLLSCSGASGSSTSAPPSNPSAPPVAGTTTPSGAYTVVVRASSGGMQSSTALTLNVQ